METSKEKDLVTLAHPFVSLWERANRINQNNKSEHENFCILTTAIGLKFDDVLSELRTLEDDYLFVHGVGKKAELYGILCTTAPKQMADVDSVFFVGDVVTEKKKVVLSTPLRALPKVSAEKIVADGYQISLLLGDDALFRIGHLAVLDKDIGAIASVTTFMAALNKFEEDTEENDAQR